MTKFEKVVLSSDGWRETPYEGVLDLTERYKRLGLDYCQDYAKAICECHIKPDHAGVLMGVTAGEMHTLAIWFGTAADQHLHGSNDDGHQ